MVNAGTNETFMPFDEERYSLIRPDGSTEILTTQVRISNEKKELQIYNLGTNDVGAQLIYTVGIPVSSRRKRKNRVNSVIIDKSNLVGSGVGATT